MYFTLKRIFKYVSGSLHAIITIPLNTYNRLQRMFSNHVQIK